jgi:RND family efflux transporter MFP subunit
MSFPAIVRIASGAAAGLIFLSSTWAQTPAQIKITAQQISAAGIRFAAVQRADTGGDGLRLSGKVVTPPSRIEMVSAPAGGIVQSLLVNSMDQIKAGSVMVRLHSPQLLEWQREYVQLSTQLALASKKTERDESLFKEGIIAASRLQETRNQLVSATVAAQERAQVLKLAGMRDAAIAALASQHGLNPVIEVRTGISGSVIEILVTPGQRVEAGAPLAKVARSGELWLELQASRLQGDQIRIGDSVTVAACKQSGRVIAIAPQMTEQSQLVMVRTVIPGAEGCLRAGQYLDAALRSKTALADGWLLPAAALLRHNGKDYVFVRNEAGVQAMPLTVITRSAESVVAQGALKAGAQVAIQGTANLKGIWLGLGNPASGDK